MAIVAERRPFHETIIEALQVAVKERNPVAQGVQLLVLTRLLEATAVPTDEMNSLIGELQALLAETEYRPCIQSAIRSLRREHRRRIM